MSEARKQTFGLVRRPWGVFYLKNKITGAQTSLKTSDKHEAQRILQAHNETKSQPHFNLSLARVYLNGADPKLATRTCQVMEHVVAKKKDETRRRWDAAIKDANFDCIRNVLVVETRPEHFDKALADGKVSSNVYLRRIHNHALGMKWLLKSVISRLQWPKPVFKDKRAITADEHAAIVARELNMERRDFYELLWHTGAAQSDGACLRAEDINWNTRTISFTRKKLKSRGTNIQPTLFRFSADVEVILKRLSDGRVALSRSMELGDKRAAATSSRIRIAAPITSAPRNRAQPETALGFVFTAWHDFAELAAYSSTAIRSRLPDFARIVTLEGDEPLSAVLAGSRTGLSGLRNGRAMAETTFCSAQVTAR